MEQDRLVTTDSSDKMTEANLDEEIAQAFAEDEAASEVTITDGEPLGNDLDGVDGDDDLTAKDESEVNNTVMSASRASSVSFFVDLNEATDKMCR